jgi:hypothetical protein
MHSDQARPTFPLRAVSLSESERDLGRAALVLLRDQEIERLVKTGSYPEDQVAMMWIALREGAGIRIVAMASAEDAELASHIMAITTYLETERPEASDPGGDVS